MSSVCAKKAKIVVLGMGNVLLKDEGLGVHIAQALKEASPSPDVDLEVLDGGTSPQVFLLLEGADKLIVIDAVRGGGQPGAVYRFAPEDIALETGMHTSVHQIGLLESLRMMDYLGSRPRDTVIIGVEPKEIGWGLELSPELEQKVPQIVELVWKEIHSGRRR